MTVGVVLARGTLMYFGAVNAGTAALFFHDKRAARLGERRVPERRLCQTASAGGWLGGLLAMHLFRHKTRKQSFQRKYASAIGGNVVVVLPALALVVASPGARSAFAAALSNAPPPSRWGGGRRPPRWRR